MRRSSRVVKADVADCLGSKVGSRITLERVTSDHTETFGEGLEGIVVRSRALEVVYSHAAVNAVTIASLGNVLERAILELIVKLRCPVVGKILLDRA